MQTYITNTFMNVDPIHNIHMLGTVSNIHNGITCLYNVQLGEEGVIQLCRNNPDMTEIALLRYSPIPPTPALVNNLKTTFCAISFDAQLTGSRKVHCCRYPNQPHPQFAFPCLFGWSYSDIGQQLGIHASCHHCVKFASNPFGPIVLMQRSSHMFPTHMTQFRIYF